MKPLFIGPAGLFIATAIFLSAATASSNSASAADKMPAPLKSLWAGPAGRSTIVEPEEDETLPAPRRGTTIDVVYHGFTPEARKSFQRAVNIWKKTLTSSVPITVDATFADLGDPNILGQGGPDFIWRNFDGAPRAGTWYVDAVANKAHGDQLDESPDILVFFNSTFPNWHFGKEPAPADTYDFETVVLHELGHGVGFLGFGRVGREGLGSVKFLGSPSAYDLFTRDRAGKRLTTYPNHSAALAKALTDGVFYDSPNVRKALGTYNERVRLFAPKRFLGGSSYSHLDEATFPAGDPNSLMTPRLSQGETIRSPGAIVKAILKDEGW